MEHVYLPVDIAVPHFKIPKKKKKNIQQPVFAGRRDATTNLPVSGLYIREQGLINEMQSQLVTAPTPLPAFHR